MLAGGTEQMLVAETGQISAVRTRQMYSIKAGINVASVRCSVRSVHVPYVPYVPNVPYKVMFGTMFPTNVPYNVECQY